MEVNKVMKWSIRDITVLVEILQEEESEFELDDKLTWSEYSLLVRSEARVKKRSGWLEWFIWRRPATWSFECFQPPQISQDSLRIWIRRTERECRTWNCSCLKYAAKMNWIKSIARHQHWSLEVSTWFGILTPKKVGSSSKGKRLAEKQFTADESWWRSSFLLRYGTEIKVQ